MPQLYSTRIEFPHGDDDPRRLVRALAAAGVIKVVEDGIGADRTGKTVFDIAPSGVSMERAHDVARHMDAFGFRTAVVFSRG